MHHYLPPRFSGATWLIGLTPFAVFLISNLSLSAADIVIPADVFAPHYFVDVTQPPYSIDNTGKTDVTEQIHQAIVDIYNEGVPPLRQKTLYFPNGTYRISDTLDAVALRNDGKLGMVHRLLWIGQSRDGTILKLDDNLPAFGDATHPKGMIRTESIGTVGYDAYDNSIWNMTLDVGAGNPGAAGIDYLANNTGSIRDVRIKAVEGSGAVGLLMTRMWPGPGFVKNLEIDGFDYGIHLSRLEYGFTFEHVVLRQQRKAGFLDENNAASIRDLDSTNAVPAIDNAGKGGLIVLVDSHLKGGNANFAAIMNSGGVFLRNVDVEGYGQGVNNPNPNASAGAPAGQITEYSSDPVLTPKGFPNARTTSLGLEIRETPLFTDNDFNNWYSVGQKTHPNSGNFDQADAIQAAIDEAVKQGKTTFYFLPGQYVTSRPLEFYGSIRRVLGFGTVIRPKGGEAFADAANPQPVILVRDVKGDDIEFSQFTIFPDLDHPPGFYGFEQSTTRPLVLRDCCVTSVNSTYRSTENAGDLYIEAGVGSIWNFDHPGQHVWARQLDPEGKVSPKITNVGSKLWILGLKTEQPGTIIDSSKGADTEVLGGLLYPVIQPTEEPMFRVENSRFSASYVTVDNSNNPDFPHQIMEIRDGTQHVLEREEMHPRPAFGSGVASMATLVVAAPASTTTSSTAALSPGTSPNLNNAQPSTP